MKRLFLVLVIVAMLVIPSAVSALTTQNVSVTATPMFISISNAPGTWDVNAITGTGFILPDTQYYSNPLGDTTVPSDPVVDGECRFTITNTSNVHIDLTVTFPNHAGGDASTNSNAGTNGATTFGAYSYFSGDDYSTDKVIAKTAGSSVGYSDLGELTDIKWGLAYKSQSNAWTSATAMTSTVVITATLH